MYKFLLHNTVLLHVSMYKYIQVHVISIVKVQLLYTIGIIILPEVKSTGLVTFHVRYPSC